MLTNQAVINAFHDAAQAQGEDFWAWLKKAALTHLIHGRDEPYTGPSVTNIQTLSSREQAAIIEHLPVLPLDELPTDEIIVTHQEVINAFADAAQELGQQYDEWLSQASLWHIVNDREAIFDDPTLSSIQGLSSRQKASIKSHLYIGQISEGRQSLFEGDKYTTQFYMGDYIRRQHKAIAHGCVAYVEQHFNSVGDPDPNYVMVITPNPDPLSETKEWGKWYASHVAQAFETKVHSQHNGVVPGGFNGVGNGNIKTAGSRMPAILLEPLFASNPAQASAIRSAEGQDKLADSLVKSIETFFPNGGKIAFSVGHKYKTSSIKHGRPDPGAELHGGGWEAEYAEKVLLKAAHKLQTLS